MREYLFRPGASVPLAPGPAEDEMLAAVTGSGIPYVEVTYRPPCDDPGWQAKLRASLADGGVNINTVHAPFGAPVDISSEDEAVRATGVAVVEASIRYAEGVGAAILVVHGSMEPIAPADRDKREALARASLLGLCARAADAGVRIAVELLPRTCLGNTPEGLRRLLDGVPTEQAGFCLDTNHLTPPWMAAVRPDTDRERELLDALGGDLVYPSLLPGVVRSLADRLITLHVSDYNGIDERHWLPFRGVVDWAAFANALADVEFRGAFVYETRFTPDGLADLLAEALANYDDILAAARAA
ncbi:sugar phosphate isomerase/epimerase [Candidatus Poribacteria bacterium]|nr:sugar phosphate isomerase/epimerase [Candidatus Poribacteria bacterium]MBT5533760.1 sugar phosphate isomerase/epimerase [Candidatus Poribacteria bacterium]MBT7806948.1 sugar phosphate isomerase/epimerase [Candidatus Poribacteria bacterium]